MTPIMGVDGKWWLIGGTAAAGVVYWAYKKSSKSTAAPTDPNIDPNTGLPYGYDTGSSSPVTGVTPSYYYNPTTSGTTSPTTNAQWAQAAEEYMTQQGYDALAVAAALGKYLTNQNLTDDQLSIVQTAIAFEGYPPTSVPAPHVAPPGGNNSTKMKRKDQPANPLPLPVGYATGTWLDIVKAHYNTASFTENQIGTAAWDLAHQNGRSGSTNPKTSKFVIILPLYLTV